MVEQAPPGKQVKVAAVDLHVCTLLSRQSSARQRLPGGGERQGQRLLA